ncbi:DUF3592 domain-containing protein [Ekhidna sp.]|uniref:DUF3592 domain-containing protein n=1 Tax=Ekhidna sp. TaxID=2608089 RepID=UPI003B505AC7
MSTEIIISLISGGTIILGVYWWRKGNHLILNGKKVDALVYANRHQYHPTNNKIGLYFPVVRFLTEEKEWITKKLEIGYNPPLEEGSKIKIIYDPDNPEYLQIDNSFMLEFLPRILVTSGLIGLILSLMYYLEFI